MSGSNQELSLDQQLAADEASRQVPPNDGDRDHSQPHVDPDDEQPLPEHPGDNRQEQEKGDAPEQHAAVDETEPQKDDVEELRKRNARIHAEKRAAEREQKRLAEQLRRMQAGEAQQETEDQRVQRLAAEQLAQYQHAQRAATIQEAGVKAFPDFLDKCQTLVEVAGGYVAPHLIEACAESSENPARLWHYLGSNPDEAERIFRMSPHSAGVAMGKLAAKLDAPIKQVSKAPPPVKPLAAMNKAAVAPDDEDIDVWMRKEDERWANRRRI